MRVFFFKFSVVLNRTSKSGSEKFLPLKNLSFVIEGKLSDKDALKESIAKLGGKVSTKVGKETAAVISNEGEFLFNDNSTFSQSALVLD